MALRDRNTAARSLIKLQRLLFLLRIRGITAYAGEGTRYTDRYYKGIEYEGRSKDFSSF